jgi:hypothetical protein
MPMRVSVRFNEEHWQLLEREAVRGRERGPRFIRGATMVRTAYAWASAATGSRRRSLA